MRETSPHVGREQESEEDVGEPRHGRDGDTIRQAQTDT